MGVVCGGGRGRVGAVCGGRVGAVVHSVCVCRWIPRLESSCRCVVGLSAMKGAVEQLRAERYSRDNKDHEDQLTKVRCASVDQGEVCQC